MIGSSSTVALMFTAIIGLHSVHLIAGEAAKVINTDKAVSKRQLEHNENDSNVVTPKAKSEKSQNSFWSNVIPFYDTVKNHVINQKNLIYGIKANQTHYEDWPYSAVGSRYIMRPEYEHPINHLMTATENDPEVIKTTRYESTRYPVYSNHRQDYEDEPDTYHGSPEPVYHDPYYPESELHNSPAMYNPLRGSSARYPPVKMCPCRNQAEFRQAALPVNCPNGAVLNLLTNLGANFWALVQLLIAVSIPLLVPLLLIKIAIVSFKVYKFIKVVKLILKIVILLPFFMRVVLPAVQHLLHHQSVVHFLKMRHNNNVLEDRSSVSEWQLNELMSDADLVTCASKSACEIGAFVAAKSQRFLPEKMRHTLKRKVERLERKSKVLMKVGDREVVGAFSSAFGKNWTQGACEVYECSISL